MIKRLKLFLCVILTVVLPFSFVACKTKKQPDSDDQTPAPSNSQPSGNESQDKFSSEEVLEIIKTSSETISTYVTSLNNSSVISDEKLDTAVAEKMISVFHFAYYPEMVLTSLTENISDERTYELDKIYYYNGIGGEHKYFKTSMVSSDKFEFIYLTFNDNGFIFGRFVLEIDKSGISSMKISRLKTTTNSAKVEFIEANLDFKNKTLENTIADLNDDSLSSETLLNKLKNNQISENDEEWSYAYYAKIEFEQNRSCESKSNAKTNVINNVSQYGFLDAFTQKNDFVSKKESNQVIVLTYDRLSDSLDLSTNMLTKIISL